MNVVYVLNATSGCFPVGVFSSQQEAETAITAHSLTGLLTEYRLDELPYDHDLECGLFLARKDHERTPQFIQRYTVSKACEHWHYENGGRNPFGEVRKHLRMGGRVAVAPAMWAIEELQMIVSHEKNQSAVLILPLSRTRILKP